MSNGAVVVKQAAPVRSAPPPLPYEVNDWLEKFGKALREARALGLIDRVPRLLAVQAAGAAPFGAEATTTFVTTITTGSTTVTSGISPDGRPAGTGTSLNQP